MKHGMEHDKAFAAEKLGGGSTEVDKVRVVSADKSVNPDPHPGSPSTHPGTHHVVKGGGSNARR